MQTILQKNPKKIAAVIPCQSVVDEASRLNTLFSTLRWQEEFLLDIDGKIMSSNLEIVNVTGYDEWEVSGKNCSIFYTDEDVVNNRHACDLNTARVQGRCVTTNIKLKKKKIPFLCRMRLLAIYDSKATLAGFKMILSDLTQKKKYNDRLQKIKQEYMHLFDNAFIGLLKFSLTPEKSKITLMNEKAEDLLKLKPGMDFKDAFERPADYERMVRFLRRNEAIHNFEFQVDERKSNGTTWVSLDCRDMRNDGLFEAVVFDITRTKEIENESNRLKKELDTFIYHASHDLRSPIASILGLINLIDLNKGVPEQIPVYAKMIKDKAEQLDDILKDLATITFNNNTKLILEEIPIRPFISGIVADMTKLERDVIIDLKMVDTEVIFSDAIRLRTILKNLISNAIRFRTDGGDCLITIYTSLVADSNFRIEISDNGIGMDDSQLVRIYNLFYRGHNSVSGSGLGLYVTKSIVDTLRGRISVRSSLGKGSTFTIEFPLIKTLRENMYLQA